MTPRRRFALAALAVLAAFVAAAQSTRPAGAAPLSSKVVGGTPAPADSWPFAAWIATWITADGSFDACTGSVLSPTVILTAAHCVVDETTHQVSPPEQIRVITGRQLLTDQTQGQVLDVAAVHVSPAYDADSGYSDAALLVLAEPTTAPAIALASDGDADLLRGGHEAQIAGWGNTKDGQADLTTQLNTASVPLRSDSYCARAFPGVYYPVGMICTDVLQVHGTGPCFGDSGGPLVITDGAGQLVLAGITSRGNRDTCKEGTTEYTRVSPLDGWIVPQLTGALDAPAPAAKPDAPLVAALKPHNTRRPFITGTPKPNGELTCHTGSWQNGGSVRYAWLYNGRLQAGVNSPVVRLSKRVRSGWATCVVRLDNVAGSTAARSKGVKIHT